MDNRNRKLLQRIILEWQQPIYNLAYRMLGATQEIFTRVIAGIDRPRPRHDEPQAGIAVLREGQ